MRNSVALMVRLFRKRNTGERGSGINRDLEADKKRKRPRLIESRTLVRTALPRKLLTPTLPSDLNLRNDRW